MIAIDLNNKRIRVRPADASLSSSEHDIFLELTLFWIKSPYLPGSPPFGFDNNTRTMFTPLDWTMERANAHGDIVHIII